MEVMYAHSNGTSDHWSVDSGKYDYKKTHWISIENNLRCIHVNCLINSWSTIGLINHFFFNKVLTTVGKSMDQSVPGSVSIVEYSTLVGVWLLNPRPLIKWEIRNFEAKNVTIFLNHGDTRKWEIRQPQGSNTEIIIMDPGEVSE